MTSPLACPGCKQELHPFDDPSGVRVDVCDCGGLWLDADELAKLGGELPRGGIEYGGDRRCPRCDVRMDVRPSKVVELDVCPKCRGLYLDPNELKLLVTVTAVAAPKARSAKVGADSAAPVAAARFEKLETATTAPKRPKPVAERRPGPSRPEKEPTEPRFLCSGCREFKPLPEQVIGAQQTLCRACAGTRGVRHDPAARRKVELEREQPTPDPFFNEAGADLLVDLLFGTTHQTGFGPRHRHDGVLDLVFKVLKK